MLLGEKDVFSPALKGSRAHLGKYFRDEKYVIKLYGREAWRDFHKPLFDKGLVLFRRSRKVGLFHADDFAGEK